MLAQDRLDAARRPADDEERRVRVVVGEHAQDRRRAPEGPSSNVSATMRLEGSPWSTPSAIGSAARRSPSVLGGGAIGRTGMERVGRGQVRALAARRSRPARG